MLARSMVSCCVAAATLACGESEPASLYGTWTVTEHVSPGRGMIESDAKAVHGAIVNLAPKRAVILRNTCDTPQYNTWTVGVRHFESDYGVLPTRLGIPGDSIRIHSVDCKGQWHVPASELIEVSGDRLVFLWDGVFFLLSRSAQ